jgi:hypothetical protein
MTESPSRGPDRRRGLAARASARPPALSEARIEDWRRLTLHRSRRQAAAYYQEAELDRNPAAALGAE